MKRRMPSFSEVFSFKHHDDDNYDLIGISNADIPSCVNVQQCRYCCTTYLYLVHPLYTPAAVWTVHSMYARIITDKKKRQFHIIFSVPYHPHPFPPHHTSLPHPQQYDKIHQLVLTEEQKWKYTCIIFKDWYVFNPSKLVVSYVWIVKKIWIIWKLWQKSDGYISDLHV